MRVVVVGASGFVGSHIFKAARAAGHDAIGTQSRDRGGELVPFDIRHERLRDRIPARWFDAGAPVCVVVAAAAPNPDFCRNNPGESRAINVTGVMRTLTDAVEAGATAIFLSSSFVFDGTRGGYKDNDARSPSTLYGRQKAEVEEFVEKRLGAGAVLRLDKTIGDDPGEKHMITEWWQDAAAGRTIRCIERQLFSPTLVDDVARGTLLAAERGLRGVYNIANPDAVLREDLATRFVTRAGLAVPVVAVSQKDLNFVELRPEKSSLDSSALMRATGLTFTPMDQVFDSFLRRAGRAA